MKQTTTKTRKELKSMVYDLYWQLKHACNREHYFEQVEYLVRQAEKQHRKFKPAHIKSRLTVSEAVQYFMCKYIVEGKTGPAMDPKQILWCRVEAYKGQALYHHHKESIDPILTKEVIENLKQFDYAEMI